MTFAFRPAKRENVGLLIGLAGGTGSGKTKSAFELAAGIAGDKPFGVIDTESRRALHYADGYRFDHCELRAPFRPDAYAEAIVAADAATYPVIVVDSASHEWAGEGGLLDWHDEEVDAAVERKRKQAESMGWIFEEWKVREKANLQAWIDPKMAHKRMVQRLLQLRAHLILCFRAEEKIEIGKDEKGRTEIRPKQTATGLDGWVPVCEKSLPYELTCSFLLKADRPGVGLPIKLQEQHRQFFPEGKQIGRSSGEAIAAWASGAPPATLDEVVAKIELAESVATLKTLKALVGAMTADDGAKARAAYNERLAELQPKPKAAAERTG